MTPGNRSKLIILLIAISSSFVSIILLRTMLNDSIATPCHASTRAKGNTNTVGSSGKVSGNKVVKKQRKWTWKKPKDMPKRPLSAYNLFFAHERQNLKKRGLLSSKARTSVTLVSKDTILPAKGTQTVKPSMGFGGLAQNIAAKWKSLRKEDKQYFEQKARVEKERYEKELQMWRLERSKRNQADATNEKSPHMNHQLNSNGASPAGSVKDTHPVTDFMLPSRSNSQVTFDSSIVANSLVHLISKIDEESYDFICSLFKD